MKCAKCQVNFPMTELLFVANGTVPKTTIKRHDAYCKDCMPIPKKPK